jgi:hypothetical protein
MTTYCVCILESVNDLLSGDKCSFVSEGAAKLWVENAKAMSGDKKPLYDVVFIDKAESAYVLERAAKKHGKPVACVAPQALIEELRATLARIVA